MSEWVINIKLLIISSCLLCWPQIQDTVNQKLKYFRTYYFYTASTVVVRFPQTQSKQGSVLLHIFTHEGKSLLLCAIPLQTCWGNTRSFLEVTSLLAITSNLESNPLSLFHRLHTISQIILLSKSQLHRLSNIVAAVNKTFSCGLTHACQCLFCLDFGDLRVICLWFAQSHFMVELS